VHSIFIFIFNSFNSGFHTITVDCIPLDETLAILSSQICLFMS
jgi:hypothetical protein